MGKSSKRKELNQSSLFSSTSKQGVASVSLTSSIFGIANDNRNEDNHDNNSDLFSNSKTFQEVSQRHQQKNRKRQRVQSSVPLLSTGANNRETILARRRQLTTATRDLVESITVDLSSYDNVGNEKQQQEEDDDNDNDDVEKGILRLAVGRSSFVVRKQGVLILKSLFSNKDQSILKSLQSHSKRIQSKVCDQLDDTLGKDSYYFSDNQTKKKDGKKDYSFRFQEVASRCLGRLDIRYGMNEPPFSNLHPPTSTTAQTKKNSLFHSLLWPLIQDLLGKDAELVYIGLIPSFPNSEDQPWHQDGCTLFPEAPPELGDSLPPYALNVFLPLLDITEELGPTEFWLASHCTNEARDTFLSSNGGAATTVNDDMIDKNKNIVAPLIQTGDALIYDYRVCHRGTSNLSTNITRPMLYLMYARPWFKEHLNFGTEQLFEL